MFSRTFFNVCKMSCESFGKNVKSSGSSELVRRLSDSKSSRSDPGQVCYENAIKTLNTVQNGDPTNHIRRKQCEHFQKAEWFVAAGKVPVEKLDKLAAIHVSGTKGKGSVCAYCESILRSSGYKIGFYSSPHLVEVRERIRINGKPISKELFTAYFWEFWNNYKETEKPSYGTFLALMSFHIFLKEKGRSELFCLNAKTYGNISRFINHSCDPNVLAVRVFTDHQVESCPRIAFFASREIKPYEEVCSDYGERFWKVKKSEFHCVCSSPKCKYKAPAASLKK